MNKAKFKKTDCPRCGTSFTCFLFRNCTCEEIEIPEETLEKIQLHYTECICIKCIRQIVEENQPVIRYI